MNYSEAIHFLVHARQPDQQTLSALYQPGTRVALYGAGSVGRDVLRILRNQKVFVSYFLDQKAEPDQQMDGIPVLRPDDPQLSQAERARTLVVVTIFNAFVEMPSIHRQLQGAGWLSVITFLEFYQPNSLELGGRFWLTRVSYYKSYSAELELTASLLADQQSLDLFAQILQFRATGDYTVLPHPDLDNQYFPGGLPGWTTPLRFVDCGACEGEILTELVKPGCSIEALAAFEPDAGNFKRLTKALTTLIPKANTIVAWPCAVGKESSKLKFDGGFGAASSVSENGSEVIQCVSLDEALLSFSPNVIKMDIEGAEEDALLGAKKIIHRHRPGLAICIYHRPDDLWKIPILLNSWDLGYRFFIRSHCYNGFDLVLYAIPEEKE